MPRQPVPAGTCRRLESMYPGRRFAYSPENLRLGRALEIFLNPDRIILGTRTQGCGRIARVPGAFLLDQVCKRERVFVVRF
jgi:UDP-glucose 6-dehydrogenase